MNENILPAKWRVLQWNSQNKRCVEVQWKYCKQPPVFSYFSFFLRLALLDFDSSWAKKNVLLIPFSSLLYKLYFLNGQCKMWRNIEKSRTQNLHSHKFVFYFCFPVVFLLMLIWNCENCSYTWNHVYSTPLFSPTTAANFKGTMPFSECYINTYIYIYIYIYIRNQKRCIAR